MLECRMGVYMMDMLQNVIFLIQYSIPGPSPIPDKKSRQIYVILFLKCFKYNTTFCTYQLMIPLHNTRSKTKIFNFLSTWGGSRFVVYIRRFIYKFLNVCPLITRLLRGVGMLGP